VAIILGVLALALVAWLAVRSFGGGVQPVADDTNTSSPTISAWDETSSPTPSSATPSEPTDSGGKPVVCPDHHGASVPDPGERDGRYHGGGLSYAAIPGWEGRRGWGVDWAYDRDGQYDEVTSSWVAIAIVGEIDVADFSDPQTAARGIMSCLASSYYYKDMTARKDLSSQAVTIDGKTGWKLVSEIHADGHPGVQGDVIQVVVLDIGRPETLSIFVSEAPIGDEDRIVKTEAALASLRVEG